jgi:hypothetical protein
MAVTGPKTRFGTEQRKAIAEMLDRKNEPGRDSTRTRHNPAHHKQNRQADKARRRASRARH